MILPVVPSLGGGVFQEVVAGNSVHHHLTKNIIAVRQGRLELCHVTPHGRESAVRKSLGDFHVPALTTCNHDRALPESGRHLLSAPTAVWSFSNWLWLLLLSGSGRVAEAHCVPRQPQLAAATPTGSQALVFLLCFLHAHYHLVCTSTSSLFIICLLVRLSVCTLARVHARTADGWTSDGFALGGV